MRLNNSVKIILALIVLLVFFVFPVSATIHNVYDMTTGQLCKLPERDGMHWYYTDFWSLGLDNLEWGGNDWGDGTKTFAAVYGKLQVSYNGNYVYCWRGADPNPDVKPVASFGADYNPAFIGQPVTFQYTGTGTPYPSVYWQFLEGVQTDTGNTTTRTYTSAGTYSVRATATNRAGSGNSTGQIVIVSGVPNSAAFTGSPLSGAVPHTVTLTSQATVPSGSTPITLYQWAVTKPSGVVIVPANGVTTTFNADQFGYYGVSSVVANSYGSGGLTKNLYLEAGLLPPLTPLPTPTPGPVQTYATIAPIPTGITPIFVPTDYRIAILNGSIGNLTVGYLNAVDNVGITFKVIGVSLANVTGIPFSYITPNIKTTVDLAGDLILSFANFGHWVLVSLGVVISSLPAEIQGLVTLGLIYQILILAIKGKAAIT